MEITSADQTFPQINDDEFDRVKDLLKWNRRVFRFVGGWPLDDSTNVRFTVWAVYYLTHIMAEGADLMHVMGNLELVVANISETSLQVMIFIKFVTLRFSKKIVKILKRMTDDIDAMSIERSINADPHHHHHHHREKEIYLVYNRIAKKFFKTWITMGIMTAIAYYVKPLQFHLEAIFRNESAPFILAYRIRTFFEINNSATFYLVWIYQSPVLYMSIWHTGAIGFLFSLTIHVCGQLSVLSFRIKNLRIDFRPEDPSKVKSIFQDIVDRHRNILELTRDINDVFGLLLLEELFVTTILIGLTCYSALANVQGKEAGQFFAFLLYSGTLLFLIYGYCAAGEYLVTESTNLCLAYYQCPWYDMSESANKQLIICMMGSSKPLQLTAAGGFYVFTLVNFTGIVKTAAGYISMLRTMI